jgi:hypothetical protein
LDNINFKEGFKESCESVNLFSKYRIWEEEEEDGSENIRRKASSSLNGG